MNEQEPTFADALRAFELQTMAEAWQLAFRVEEPERGWRLIDIIGAPRRAQEPQS